MKRRLSRVMVGGLLALASLYFAKYALLRKPPPVPATELPTPQTEEPKPEIKAATPEDPGPIATVISPLNTWTKDTKLGQMETPIAVNSAPSAADHVTVSSPLHPQNFLHGTFQVREYARADFMVPPYAKSPRLYGRFSSRPAMPDGAPAARDSARVEILLLTAEEHDDFLHGRHCTVTRAASPAASQTIDWALASTSRQPRKYYLMFHNPDPGSAKVVDADFTIVSE